MTETPGQIGLAWLQVGALRGDHLVRVKARAQNVARLEKVTSPLVGARADLHQAIREAHQAGHSYRAIAQAAGLSHQRIAQLLQKDHGAKTS